MFKNQYIIVSDCVKPRFDYEEIRRINFDRFHIYAHSSLNVSISSSTEGEIGLIGYIIDPLHPDLSNDSIVKEIAFNCKSIEDCFRMIQGYTGRYVLLIKKINSFIILGDACHLRQIYFGFDKNKLVVTSSLKFFLDFFRYELQSVAEKSSIINSSLYKKLEMSWYGDKSIDNRLNKLLPNHYFDVHKKEVKRLPLFPDDNIKEEDVLSYASSMLKGTYSALSKRYHLIQPLTAGWDSRILLSASKEVKDQIEYYVFGNPNSNIDDVRIPLSLSKSLDLNFKIIDRIPLSEDFLEAYKKEHIVPRVLPKTSNINYHFNCNYKKNTININGNCTEITRCFFGYTQHKITLDMLLVFSGYHNEVPFFKKAIKEWYNNALPFAKHYNISLLDLFYWEQRMGNWGALFPFELDIAMEEISPFNNRSLLLSFLNINPQKRKSPKFSLFKNLIYGLWKETLCEPINPSCNSLLKFVHGNSDILYLSKKIHYKL